MTNIYIPDTNILLEVLRGDDGFAFINNDNQRNKLFSLLTGKYRVVIPMHSFLETAYQFFQIRIDVDNYAAWYRQRKILFNYYLVHPITTINNIALLREIPGQYYAANRIMEPIHQVYLNKVKERSEVLERRREERGEAQRAEPRDPKFLDGMDAAILEEAIYVAQSNPRDTCKLLTSDIMLRYAVTELATAYGNNAAYAPPNLTGISPFKF